MNRSVSGLSIYLAVVLSSLAGCKKETPSAVATQETLTVAAAADLKYALDEVVKEFQGAHPSIKVQVSYGSSGNFYSQLSQHAPFDLFLSADMIYPTQLIESGLARPDSKFLYAIGRIVLWVSTNSSIDLNRLGVETLRQPEVRKIAIANPAHAPYGRAAVAAMQTLRVYDQVKDRLVYAENVAQTAQFVESGAADAGVIALSLAIAPAMKDRGRYWEIPIDAYPRMNQGGVILAGSAHPGAAGEFRAFMMSPSGKSVLRRYGFFMPDE